MRNIIKLIAFFAILSIIFCYVFSILWIDKNPMSAFYKEPKNTMDIIYIGGSNAYVYFNTTLAYNLYGYTTGMVSTDAQPFAEIKYLIKESEKYQTPNLYVIDIAKVADDFSVFSNEDLRKTFDSLKFSKNRADVINEILSYTDVKKDDYYTYHLSWLMYHNNWKEITETRFKDADWMYKGYGLSKRTIKTVKQEEYTWKNELTPLQPDNERILLELLSDIKDGGFNVLFIVPIKTFDEQKLERVNTAISIIQENGFEVINFNNIKEINIDYDSDFYNENHINVYGSTKYTLYFAKHLKDKYNLPNHIGDPKYDSWSSEYERFKVNFNKKTKKNFDQLLEEYSVKK